MKLCNSFTYMYTHTHTNDIVDCYISLGKTGKYIIPVVWQKKEEFLQLWKTSKIAVPLCNSFRVICNNRQEVVCLAVF